MKYIDFHCDTLLMLVDEAEGQSLYSNEVASVDFKRLKKSEAMAQFFAMFLMDEETINEYFGSDDEYINKLAKMLKDEIAENSDIISMAYNAEDLLKNYASGKVSTFLTIEDGRSVDGKLEKLDEYYDLGVRLITLTWNYENCFGYPNSKDPEIMNKGLKNFGKEAIEYMNHIGMIIDVSHLSDGGFYDVAKISKKPFVASHSNARELSPHPRNMTDDMIKILAENGGIMGLNFAPCFLNEDITLEDSKIELMVKHLNHIKNIGGEDVIALGSDFDGISGNLEIDSSDKMYLLFDALKDSGWSERLIEKLAYKNALRVIKDTL